MCLCVLAKKCEDEHTYKQQIWIKQIRHDLNGGDPCDPGSDQKLCAVRDDPLGDTGGDIHKRSRPLRRDLVFFADIGGDGCRNYDGYGVVGCGDIHQHRDQDDA